MNYPIVTKITNAETENKDVKTLLFDFPKKTVSGQFFMIWIPDIDEIPMSASYINGDAKGVTFRRVGEATNALFDLKEGDKIGVRGPYGNGFQITEGRLLFVGGGTGVATLTPAVEEATGKNISSTVVLGVKNKDELFFEDRLKSCGAEVYVSTDDGSKGYKGLASDLAVELLNKNRYDSVLTCGPEIMMKKIMDASKSISFQASLERYMKCGIGLCGQCCLGKGLRVCVEGPVLDSKTLRDVEDFGVYKRDASGRKVQFKI
jgi:dihydroorotate dehydrogenase electron transfer subunit